MYFAVAETLQAVQPILGSWSSFHHKQATCGSEKMSTICGSEKVASFISLKILAMKQKKTVSLEQQSTSSCSKVVTAFEKDIVAHIGGFICSKLLKDCQNL